MVWRTEHPGVYPEGEKSCGPVYIYGVGNVYGVGDVYGVGYGVGNVYSVGIWCGGHTRNDCPARHRTVWLRHGERSADEWDIRTESAGPPPGLAGNA